MEDKMRVAKMTKSEIKKYIREEMDKREKRYMDLINKIWKKIVAIEIKLDMKTKKMKFPCPGRNEK